jgi:lipoprotein-releasing system ATP-binding protein
MHAEHGLTSIIVTHNPRLAATCDRICRLEGGRLAAVAEARIDSGPPAG